MEGKGEEKRNQGGKLVAKGKSGSEERLFGSSSNYKTSPAPRRESSSELPVIVVTLVFIKVSLATGKHRHSQMPGICLALRVSYCFKNRKWNAARNWSTPGLELSPAAWSMWEAALCQQCLWLGEVKPDVGLGSSPLPKPSIAQPASSDSLGNVGGDSVTWQRFIRGGGERTGQVTDLRCGTGTWWAGLGLTGLGFYFWPAGWSWIKAWFLSFPLCKMGLMVLTLVKLYHTEILSYFRKEVTVLCLAFIYML